MPQGPLVQKEMPPMNKPSMDNDPMSGGSMDGMDNGGLDDNTSDPKKGVQKLTGKLSQELRTYNDNQQNPDTELNKYVAGMIIPQASKGMTDKDKQEVINKIKNGNVGSDESLEDNEPIVNEIVNSLSSETNRDEKKIMNSQAKKRKNPFITNR
jgi:hypothetical protein